MVKFIISCFILLFASFSANSADADYCLDLNDEQPRVVFVKKYNDLKSVPSNIQQEPLECENYLFDTVPFFKFFKESYLEDYLAVSVKTNRSKKKPLWIVTDNKKAEERLNAPVKFMFPPIIQDDYPKSEFLFFMNDKEHKKRNLLLFKKKTIDASITIYISCSPHFSTMYNLYFRARIVGECTAPQLRSLPRPTVHNTK